MNSVNKITLVVNKDNLPSFTHLLQNSKSKENLKVVLQQEGIRELLLGETKSMFEKMNIPVFEDSYRLENILDFVSGEEAGNYTLLFTHKKDMKKLGVDQTEYSGSRNEKIQIQQITKSELPATMEILNQKLQNQTTILERL